MNEYCAEVKTDQFFIEGVYVFHRWRVIQSLLYLLDRLLQLLDFSPTVLLFLLQPSELSLDGLGSITLKKANSAQRGAYDPESRGVPDSRSQSIWPSYP